MHEPYQNKVQRDPNRKTQGSQRSSRNNSQLKKQAKRKSQSFFNNDDLIGFISGASVKKENEKSPAKPVKQQDDRR